jgi:hypothetical protein
MDDWGPHWGPSSEEPSGGLPSSGWKACLIFFGIFVIFVAVLVLTIVRAA